MPCTVASDNDQARHPDPTTLRRRPHGKRDPSPPGPQAGAAAAQPPHIKALPPQVHGCVAGNRGTIYVVRRRDLLHVPRTPEYSLESYRRQTVLTLCPAFATHGDCPQGSQCRQVHVRLRSSCGRFRPHFAPVDVPLASECFSAELPAVPVSHADDPPNATARTLVRPSECLITRANMADEASKLVHCQHWLRAGLCHYGASCKFVHALSTVDAMVLPSSSSQRGASTVTTSTTFVTDPSRSPTASSSALGRAATATTSNTCRRRTPHSYPYQHTPYHAPRL